jgi:8-oxo-dGTP pyrophosphatase MutT (NUDIX family)
MPMIDSAVMIPVYRTQIGELHIVMIRRNAGGVHGGQIAFPGGKHDSQDETMLDTALREVHEELGVRVAKQDVLAELPMEQTRTTGYRVFPYLARISVPTQWQIDRREIAELFDITLNDLTRPGAHEKMIDRFPGSTKAEQIPYYRVGSHRLWGLSYRILHPVIPRLVAGEWDV